MSATLKDIAERCGVSRQTVSFALTSKGRISAETRKRVVDAAREMGYRPNSIARTMRRGRFHAVTLLLSSEEGRSWMPEPLIEGIHDELARNDISLGVVRLPDDKLVADGEIPRLLREWGSDGMLVNYISRVPDGFLDILDRYHIPSISINVRRETDCVHPDDEAAGYDATVELLKLGHRHIAFAVCAALVPGVINHYSVDDRIRGFQRAMAEAGLPAPVCSLPTFLPPDAWAATAVRWIADRNHPTAFVACGEGEALSLILAAQSRGLHVPEDISVIAFAWGGVMAEALRTSYMILPERSMGRRSVQMLLAKIEAPEQPLPAVTLPFEPADHRSLRPPKTQG